MKNKKENNFLIVVIILIIIVALVYFLFLRKASKNIYETKEDEMVLKAQNYVEQNSLSISKEIYIDVLKLNVSLDDKCSITSGVIYDGKKYQAYLVCGEYKTKVIDNSKVEEYIKLIGDEVIVLPKGMNYVEPGYISKDKVDIVGEIGTEEGIYNIYYSPKNSNQIAIRKVVVVENDNIKKLYPTISLKGKEIEYVVENNSYEEKGVEARDNIDGDITDKVEIEDTVNTSIVGEYVIKYQVTNSKGYSNSIERKVSVISSDSDLEVDYVINPNTITNKNVVIKLIPSSDKYTRIMYPNNSEGTDLEYEVESNGTYIFRFYDEYNREVEKEIVIDNIDKTVPTGTCIATRYLDRTEIKVTVTSKREISSYEYIINSNNTNNSKSNSFKSSIVKPSSVKVKMKDAINNQSEITCSFVDKLVPKIYTDSKGKNCLEGYVCYVQFDYSNSSKYPYCSMMTENSCGGIGRNGCSITSLSIASTRFNLKPKSGGIVHTPYTIWEEAYPINKRTGYCNGGCSAWTRIRDAAINLGLTAPKRVSQLNRTTVDELKKHLQKGYPVVVHASQGPYTSGNGHYLSILGIREDDYVFLSDSALRSGTQKDNYKGKMYYADTWIPIDDLISGNIDTYLLIGPAGMYES